MPFDMRAALAGLMPAQRDLAGSWYAVMGINPQEQALVAETAREIGRLPADEAWVYRCVNIKATFAQSVPLVVDVRDGSGWAPLEGKPDGAGADLQALLDDVNPVNMSGSDLKAWTVAATSVWGESEWQKVRGRLGGAPQELHWLRTPDLEPVMGASWIDAYRYRPEGSAVETMIPARDIVPFRRINLADPTRGLSPLASARWDVSVSRNASEWGARTLANDSVPPMVWVIPKDADFTEQDQSLVRRALRSLRGPKGKGKVPILPQGLEPKVLSLNPRDAEWIAARKVSRMTVCAVMGVPLVLAGDDDKASVYANLRDAERVFARTMIGELDWIADNVNSWLVGDFDPAPIRSRRLRVRFDYREIESLQSPLEDRKRVALSEVQTGVRSRDEYRREFRVGPDLEAEVPQFVQLQTLLPVEDAGAGAELIPAGTAEPTTPPEPERIAADEGSDFIRHLYREPAVRAWMDGGPLEPVAALLGVPASDQLAVGLRRRYTARQLLDGVPGEGFGGLKRKEAIA